MNFKTVRLTTIRNGPKRMIFVSGGFGLLQMVLESDTERCASEDAESSRGMDCEIPHWSKKGTKHSLYGRGRL